jgi:ABC-2 type transport system permease protein
VLPSPRRIVKKYWHVINIGIQNNLAYRVNFLFRILFGFVPLLATIYLWRAVYHGKPSGTGIGGLSLAQMTSYYLIVTIVDSLTAVNEDDWQIAADIKDGNISQFLLKPINYLIFRLCLFFSGRVIYFAVAAVPLSLFIFSLRAYFIPPPDAATFALFLVSVTLTALLQFFMSFAMAMLAFWVLEVSTFIFILFAFEFIASGHLFPLNILPPALERVLYCTPFPYQMYFPVSIYTGQARGADIARGLVVQAAWVIAAWLFARFAWSRGLKKYTAVGG